MAKCSCCDIREADSIIPFSKATQNIKDKVISSICLSEYGLGLLAKRIWNLENQKVPGTFKGVETP